MGVPRGVAPGVPARSAYGKFYFWKELTFEFGRDFNAHING